MGVGGSLHAACAPEPATAITAPDAPLASASSCKSSKLSAIMTAVASAADHGERCVVFVDHVLLVNATVQAIKQGATAASARSLTARGVKATTKRTALEASVAALAKPLDAGGIDALVLTLRVGAVGLNLASASRVIFAAPCLDTSLRRQAVGRCHRMGQTRPVTVTTLAMQGTVEEAALGLMHREDLPIRYAPNGDEVRDQHTLRLAAIEEVCLP